MDHERGAWFRILHCGNRNTIREKSNAGKVGYHNMGACWDVLGALEDLCRVGERAPQYLFRSLACSMRLRQQWRGIQGFLLQAPMPPKPATRIPYTAVKG